MQTYASNQLEMPWVDAQQAEFRVGSTTTLTASVFIDLVTRFENSVTSR